jgi:CP family cyanate transporter-like MFS transporter
MGYDAITTTQSNSHQVVARVVSAPVAFFAPIYTGWMHDVTGNYTTPFTIFTVLTIVSAVTVCLAQVPKSPTKAREVLNCLRKNNQ